MIKLQEVKFDCLKNEKSIAFSNKYVIICTGKRVIVCDRDLSVLKTFCDMHYVYDAKISPDEQQLLLISSSNCFYVVDLNSFEIRKHTVIGTYSGNLEGRGCWAFDSQSFYLVGSSKRNGVSAIIQYNTHDATSPTNLYLAGRYSIFYIKAIQETGQYVAVGLDHNRSKLENGSSWSIIKFDGENSEELQIPEIFGDCVRYVQYHPTLNSLKICCIQNDVSIALGVPKDGSLFKINDIIENNAFKLPIGSIINSYCLSSDEAKIYIATNKGLFVGDYNNRKIIASKRYKHGVLDVKELNNKLLLLSTVNGIKAFEILSD